MSGDSGSFFGLGGVPLNEEIVESSIWSFRARIGREDFWRRSIVIGALAFAASFIIGLLVNANTATEESAQHLTALLTMPLNIAFGLFLLATHVKRWHDLNYSGWISLINFVPQAAYLLSKALPHHLLYNLGLHKPERDAIEIATIVLSLFVLIFLGFIKGTKGPNSFGADPV
jgi:uncharacterized membrane protein YhaH (DUF805 family)